MTKYSIEKSSSPPMPFVSVWSSMRRRPSWEKLPCSFAIQNPVGVVYIHLMQNTSEKFLVPTTSAWAGAYQLAPQYFRASLSVFQPPSLVPAPPPCYASPSAHRSTPLAA